MSGAESCDWFSFPRFKPKKLFTDVLPAQLSTGWRARWATGGKVNHKGAHKGGHEVTSHVTVQTANTKPPSLNWAEIMQHISRGQVVQTLS